MGAADVAAAFKPGDHGSTYSGQPLATAAARKVLEVMQRDDLPGAPPSGAPTCRERLEKLDGVGSVRGAGLILAAELGSLAGPEVAAACLDRGLVVNGITPTAIRLTPPLTVSEAEIDEAIDLLGAVLEELAGRAADAPLPRGRRPGAGRVGGGAGPPPRPAPPPVLAGRGMALVFEKPSARTRHSMEMAVVQLGGHPVYVQGAEVGMDERESVEDVARTLACYHAAIGARVFAHRTVERMAAVSPVPIVNLLSDQAHPMQALADPHDPPRGRRRPGGTHPRLGG